MPPEDERDDDAPGGPPLPPEDRLWRHPSELLGPASAPVSLLPQVAPRTTGRRWGLLIAGLAGATLTLGAVVATGGWRNRVVEPQAVTTIPTSLIRLEPGMGVADLVKATSPAVAGVRVTVPGGTRTGSAVVLGPSGHLVTSAALVQGAGPIAVTLADGTTVAGSVVGADLLTGLAVLHVDGATPEPAPVAADRPAVGSMAVSLAGSPTGGPGLVSSGVIRGLAQASPAPSGQLRDLIQTDQPALQGSAGGALIGSDGAVVGISLVPSEDPSAASSQSGWAVPIDVATQVVADIVADGRAHHVWMGVEIADQADAPVATAPAGPRAPGAVITSVSASSPAASSGLHPGDEVTAIDGTDVSSMADLIAILRRHRPGDRVEVRYSRDASARVAQITLREQSAD